MADTIPWMVFIIAYVRRIKNRFYNKIMFSGVVYFLLYTFVYDWGSNNGGQAMRHRGELIGPLIMFMMVGISLHKKNERKVDVFYPYGIDKGKGI